MSGGFGFAAGVSIGPGGFSIGAGFGGLSGSWRLGLMPGSWRGVPFLCRDTGNPSGRRLAKFEFPDSDQVYVQDRGRGIKTYTLEIYVCGDDYMAGRDALEAALDQDGLGTLVHPYLGPLQVYAEHPCQKKELSEKGRAAFFECKFVEAGSAPEPPVASTDTATASFNSAAGVQDGVAAAYAAPPATAAAGAPAASAGGFNQPTPNAGGFNTLQSGNGPTTIPTAGGTPTDIGNIS